MIYHGELRTLADTLPFHARCSPETVALINGSRQHTYRELNAASNRTARALLAEGTADFSRVAYLGQETAEYYELLFACAKARRVLVPINWRLTGEEVGHVLRDSHATLIIVEQALMPLVQPLLDGLDWPCTLVCLGADSAIGLSFEAWRQPHADRAVAITVSEDDPVVQLYTSGTTGLPKGVVLAHRSFFKVRDALHGQGRDWIDWRGGDVSLIGIPGFHVGGVWWSTQGFNAGVTNVSMRSFASRDAVELIGQLGITVMCVVPAMIQMMLNEHGVGNSHFASLRKVVYGGSPIGESLLRQAINVMDCEFAQIYGLTETGNTAVCLPPEAHVVGSPMMKAAGRPYPGFGAKVIDADGRTLPAGEVGEVCLRTPSAMLEYWQRPEATAQTLIDGWIHTGDAGYLDDQGYLYICDRLKDTVIVAGENIYPAEVEKALTRLPQVMDAAVIGVPDERWGEALMAFVVPRPGAAPSARELMLGMRGAIADFKIPGRYELIGEIPRNPSGKVLRRVLREKFWAGRERQVN